MKFNFRKIAAVASSALMVGMTAGVAAAANYPAPFVVGSSADVAIVYGTGAGVSSLDLIQAGNIQTNLQSSLGTTSAGTSTNVDGEAASLASGTDYIYLNDELNENVQTITKDELTSVLADGTFTDDDGTDYKYEQIITVGSDATFAFGNSDNDLDDPALMLVLPTSGTLYNLTATFNSAVNFTDSASEGESITLFGKTYTVGTATDSDTLVLLGGSDAEKIEVGETKTLVVGDNSYEVVLNGISSATAAQASISVNGVTKTFTEGQTKEVADGVDLFAKTVFRTGDNMGHVEIEIGADKLTFETGLAVTTGSDNDEIEGTLVTFGGTPLAMNSITVQVFAEDNDANHVLVGEEFTDPVFGTVSVVFQDVVNGPSLSGMEDTATGRNKLEVVKGGNRELQITATDAVGNTKTIPFTYQNNTADDNSGTIHLVEGATMSKDDYFILNSGNYQHFMQLTKVDVDTSGQVSMKDLFTGETYSTPASFDWSAGSDTLTISGQTYTVTNLSTSTVKVTSSDIADNKAVFPYLELVSGENHRFAITDNVQIITSAVKATSDISIDLPTGTVALALTNDTADDCNLAITGTGVTTTNLDNGTLVDTVTVGSVDYVFTIADTDYTDEKCTAVNVTVGIESTQSATGDTTWNAPGLLFVEDEDKSETTTTTKNAVFLKADDDASYSYVHTPVFTSTGYDTQDFDDTDYTGYITNFGTYVLYDSSDTNQEFASLTYPKTPMYANVFVAGEGATITSSSSSSSPIGEVLVKDSEVSSVSTKNLIVVGGSCINSAAATLLGGAYCSTDFTTNTGVGSGEYLIKSFSGSTLTSKMALLVAGYDAADTVNAAKYLTTQTVDTSKEYKGTSGTTATVVA